MLSFLVGAILVFFLLLGALFLLLLTLGYLFRLFNWIEELLGPLAQPLFWAAFFIGIVLLVWAWGEAEPIKGYIGALLVVSSALYFLSEATGEV